MAFAPKTDFSGLAAKKTALKIRDDNENPSVEIYQPTGGDGSFCDLKVYGEDAAPSNNFALSADIDFAEGDITLGDITAVGSKKYALKSVSISTGGGQETTLTANCQLVEDGADAATMCKYIIEAFKLLKRRHAQILFDSFQLTGERCDLTQCSAEIACNVDPTKVAGIIIASDVSAGQITITGSVLQCGTTVPTLTAANGFTITKPLSAPNPETAKKTYTFELRKNLEKTSPAE